MNRKLWMAAMALWLSGPLSAQEGRQVIWLDEPCPADSLPVWGEGEVSPAEGSGMVNKDWEWEHVSLPIGNGSIGANVFGPIGEERFTFNEKSLWRG